MSGHSIQAPTQPDTPASSTLRSDFQSQAAALALVIAAGACIGLGGLLFVHSVAIGVANLACGIVCLGLLVRLMRGADPATVTRIACSALVYLVVGESYYLGGHESPVLLFLGPLIAAMALLFRQRDAVVLTVIGVASVAGYFFLDRAGLVPPTVMPPASQSFYSALYGASAFGLIGLFVTIWATRHRRLEAMMDESLEDLRAEARAAGLRARAAGITSEAGSFEAAAERYIELVAEAAGLKAAHLWLVDGREQVRSADIWCCRGTARRRAAETDNALKVRTALVYDAVRTGRNAHSAAPGDPEHAHIADAFGGYQILMLPVDVDGRTGLVIECIGRADMLAAARTRDVVAHIAAQLGRWRERDLAGIRIQELAYRDAVTGLPNRNAFETAVQQQVANAAAAGSSLALMFIDLDGFKRVNDSLGHEVGDRLLKTVGQRLLRIVGVAPSETIPGGDFVARLGGDEFTVVLTGDTAHARLEQLAAQICSTVCEPVELGPRAARVGASIGTAVYPQDADNLHDLMRLADAAMYDAKHTVGKNFGFANPALTDSIARRTWIETQLPQAIDRGELALLYQPIVSTLSGTVIAHEGLLRWQHPSGCVMPVEFIPVAESCGMVHRITEWNVVLACRQLAANRASTERATKVSLNLTPIELQQPGLVEMVQATMRRHDCAPGSLEFEISETHPIFAQDVCGRVLEQLHEVGVHVALDHYGAGAASFANLRRLPVRRVKIDRIFADELDFGDGNHTIRRAVISMAHSLGIDVTLCGVETETQAREYRELGCDALQGNWLGLPLAEPYFDSPLSATVLPAGAAAELHCA